MKNAAVLALLLAACTDGIDAAQPDPTTPLVASVTSTAGDKLIIATGGAATVAIADQTSIGLEGNASAGYTVEPFERNQWPNTISTEYWIRATAAGAGSYEIVTSKGIATGLVHSADLARIALVPANYELAADKFALAADRTQVQVALYGATGRRLVDATLAISEPQTAWDRASVAATAGTHTIAISAESFGDRSLAVDVVDGVADRLESVRLGDRTCFHAYRGDVELAVGMTFSGGVADPQATNCAITSADPNGLRVTL